jgi:hypothetical protein
MNEESPAPETVHLKYVVINNEDVAKIQEKGQAI